MRAKTAIGILIGTILLAVVSYRAGSPAAEVTTWTPPPGRMAAPDLFAPADQIPPPTNGSRFITVTLPRGVSLDLPRGWRILDAAENEVIQAGAEAALNLSGQPIDWSNEALLIAANSMPRTTYAALRLKAVMPPLAHPNEVRTLTVADVEYLGREMVEQMTELLPRNGLEVLKDLGAQVILVGGHPALDVAYRRTGPHGPVIVHLVQVYGPSTTLTVNLSYRESEQGLWLATLRRIAGSIRLEA